jgi:hypothetical protein
LSILATALLGHLLPGSNGDSRSPPPNHRGRGDGELGDEAHPFGCGKEL